MIEGLKVTVRGVELAAICRTREAHHRQREQFYIEKIKGLEGVDLESKMSGGNPVQQLEQHRDRHRQDADELKFIAEHLVDTETYQLDRSDLQRIGVVRSFNGF